MRVQQRLHYRPALAYPSSTSAGLHGGPPPLLPPPPLPEGPSLLAVLSPAPLKSSITSKRVPMLYTGRPARLLDAIGAEMSCKRLSK